MLATRFFKAILIGLLLASLPGVAGAGGRGRTVTESHEYIGGAGPGGGTSIDSKEVHHGSFFLAVPKGSRNLKVTVEDATGSEIGVEFTFLSCEDCSGITVADDHYVGDAVSCSGGRVRVPATARWVQVGLGTSDQASCPGPATTGTLTLVFGLRP